MTRIKTKSSPMVWLVLLAFLVNTVIAQPLQAANVPFLPVPGTMVSLTPSFAPPMIVGIKVFKNAPFKFEFIMSQGDQAVGENSLEKKLFLKEQANKLVKYFLASLAVPEKDMWVNLSPYQHDRIIPQEFGITEMGKEMLAQDYLLKQVTASVMYPEGAVGREFWNKIYQEAAKRFGTTNIPVNTFNKVWILPDKAVVYENAVDNTAVVVQSKLKVMLEEDYLALNKSTVQLNPSKSSDANRQLSNQLIRQVILPLIEKEVNTGKNFATLRQVYNSLILAFWYKNKLKESLISKGYVNRQKVNGVDVADKNVDQEIYEQYLSSYKKGVYNYIKEDVDPITQEVTPRKYFSGGIVWDNLPGAEKVEEGPQYAKIAAGFLKRGMFVVTVGLAGLLAGKSTDLNLRTNTKVSIFNGAVAKLNQSIPYAVGGSQNLANAAMLGRIRKHLTALAVGIALLAGANSAHAEHGAYYLMQHGHNNAVAQQVSTTPLKVVNAIPQHGVYYLTHEQNNTVTQQAAAKPQVTDGIQQASKILNDLNGTFQNATQLDHIVQAFFHPVTSGFNDQAKALGALVNDPGFAHNVSGPQHDKIVHDLNGVIGATKSVVQHWNTGRTGGGHQMNSSNSSAYQLSGDLHQLDSLLKTAQNDLNGINVSIQPPVTVTPPATHAITPTVSAPVTPAATITPPIKTTSHVEPHAQPQGQSATNDIQHASKILNDLNGSFQDATKLDHIVHAFFHPVTSGLNDEAKALSLIVNEPGFAQNVAGPQHDKIVHDLNGVIGATKTVVQHWNPIRPGKQMGGANTNSYQLAGDLQNLENVLNIAQNDLNGINHQIQISGTITTPQVVPAVTVPVTPETPKTISITPPSPIIDVTTQTVAITHPTKALSYEDELAQVQKQLEDLKVDQRRLNDQKVMDESAPGKLQDQIDQMKKLSVEPVNANDVTNDITYLNSQLTFNQKFAHAPMDKVDLPVHLDVAFNFNYPWLSYDLTGPKANPAIVFNFNYPGSRVVEGYQIANGLMSGSSDVLGEVLGPVRLVEIAMEYDNQFKAQATKGQDKEYNLDKSFPLRVWDTVFPFRAVHVTSANQNGEKKEYDNWDSGWFHNFGVIISLPGKVMPQDWRIRYIFPDPDGSLTIEKPGIVHEADRYHKAFNYLASVKKDGDKVYFFNVYQRLTDTNDVYQNPNDEFTTNSSGAFTQVKKGTVKDPYVRAWEDGYVMAVNSNNVATVYGFYSSPTFINNEMMQKISGSSKATINKTVIQPVWSDDEIKREIAFKQSLLTNGNSGVIGVRRDGVDNAIELDGFIKASDTKKAATVLDTHVDEKGVVRFNSGKNTTAPSLHPAVRVPEPGVAQKIFGVVTEEVTTPLHEVQDMLFIEPSVSAIGNNYAIGAKADDIASRPIVNVLPGELTHQFGQGDVFDGGKELRQAEFEMNIAPNVGVLHRFDTWIPQTVQTTDGLKDTFWLAENKDKEFPTNATLQGSNIVVAVNGLTHNVPIGALVKVENNRIVGVFEANINTMQKWIVKAQADSVRLDKLTNGLSGWGVSFNVDANGVVSNDPQVVTNINDFVPAQWANGNVVGQQLIRTTESGTTEINQVTSDMMVKVQGGKVAKVAAVLESGDKTLEVRYNQLEALTHGGLEVLNEITGRYEIYSPDQETTNGVLSSINLVKFMAHNQTAMQPVVPAQLDDKGKPVEHLVILPKPNQERVPGVATTADGTIEGFLKSNVLIVWSAHETQWASIESLNTSDKLASALAHNGIQILQLDAKGKTVAIGVKMFGGSYQIWKTADLRENMKDYYLVNLKDGQGSEYVSLKQLKDPQIHETIRQVADEVIMMDPDQNVTARVYLNRNINGSRIEVMQDNNASLIFELPSFSPLNLTGPVARTISVEPKDSKDGLLHVITTDLRVVNQGVVVEDVYQSVPDGKPVLLYSDRFLQNDRIYFKDGHEYYSVLIDASNKDGQTVTIDGKSVDNVTGIFHFDQTSNSGYHVNLRDLDRNGRVAPIRYTQFADDQTHLDQTGFVSLFVKPGEVLSYEGIMQKVEDPKLHVLNMKDIYSYHSDGQFDNRVVSFLVNGQWQIGWTLKGSSIGALNSIFDTKALMLDPDRSVFDQLAQNDLIREAFENYKITPDTSFIETIKTDTDGVVTKDYRILGDVLEKKIMSVIEQDGVGIKIIVGLNFNDRTGEQTFACTLTPDGQMSSLSRTVPNELSYRQLVPKGVEATYAEFMEKHLGITGADYWADLEKEGISPDFIPVEVEETPFLIATDQPKVDGYKLIEPKIRPLVAEYTKASENERPAILKEISDTVRQYHRDSNTAHYTAQQGQPSRHYLAPANDSRGLSGVAEQRSTGETVLNLWQLQGNGVFPANILPASIVVDSKTGKLKRTMILDHHEKTQFLDLQDQTHNLGVNVYTVYDDPGLKETATTSLGDPVYQTSLYQRNRVGNGIFGVQTRGEEKISFDPLFQYSLPLEGALQGEDGRITKVTLHLEYSVVNGHQKLVETSLVNEPTAPGDFRVKTQTIIDGKPIPGSLHEEGTIKGYWASIKQNWEFYLMYPGALAALFLSGSIIRKARLDRIKKGLAEESVNNAVEQLEVPPPQEAQVIYPSWSSYGFKSGAVEAATRRFEGTIVPLLKKEPLEDVLKEYFNGYQIWRTQVMGIEEPFVPTIEDLWVMFLRDADNDIFNADVPDGLNYLMHKAIEARLEYKKKANIGGFIRKEYTRWHNIIELQQTTFQGFSGGKMKHVVPYDYYFTVEDLNDMFRTKANIEWYDNLGYSLNGKTDRRDAIYKEFILDLKEKVMAAKAGIEAMADDVGGNIFKMKRKVTSVPEYQDYIQFFKAVQKGEYFVSEDFNFPGISPEEANLLIDQKPLMRKTFSESGSWVGRMPLPLRLIKPVAQFIRNSYNQLTYPVLLTTTVGLYVAAYDGMLSWGAATLTAAAAFIATRLFYYPLSYLLDMKLNNKSFGKPAEFGAGYNKVKLSSAQKWYRAGFWSTVISAKITWDAFLIHYFLVPYRETLGGTYFPVILGHEIPVNFNPLLLGMMWSTSAIFLYVGNFAANYLIKPFFTYIHGSLRGLGTIRTPEDIRRLQDDNVLDRLIEQKLLPHGGAGLNAQQLLNARRAIIQFAFDQHRAVRDEISDEEYRMAIEEGRLDQIKIPEVQKSVAQSVNALLMDMPRMPHPDEDTPITVLTPVFGEDIIYAYEGNTFPTTLDLMLNTGHTNLNYIISKSPQRWKNLIERVRRERIGTEDEWQRMEALLHQNGTLGEISKDLKMQIRLWASYEGQPYARTLDGLMNIVRWHQLYLRLSYPDWTDQEIRDRTNQDVQILWAYQVWGDVLNATKEQLDLEQKRDDTNYLLKKYYDELGYFIEIASLQVRHGVSVKVLSRYNPDTQRIEDVIDIPNTEHKAIAGEGKPSNQMHAQTFARNKFRFTIDMNQDLDPLEAMKIPIIIQEFRDKNVGLVNTPEVIFTGSFSKTGMFHVISDRTFVTSDKRHMGMVSSPSHHGHPDVWRDTDIIQNGGVSSTVAVSEDYKGGIRLMLRGRTILNREYMQWKKARELSWTGTDGIWRKFSMGAAQLLLGRYAHWMNKSFGPVEGAGEFYSGPHFYMLNTVAALGFFVYGLNVMIGGISPFTAVPAPCVTMMMGVFWVGQALTVIGLTQMALEDGVRKAIIKFARIMPLMAPFYIAHIFTYQAGFLSGIAGLAAYVVTGRGFNREHIEIEKFLKAFSKSHVAVGAVGLGLSAIAYSIWRNETFLLSSVTVLSFLFPTIIPFMMNPGNYPIHGVTVRHSAELFKNNTISGLKSLGNNFWHEGVIKKNYRKAFIDTISEAVSYGVWLTVTAPVAIPGLIINAVKGTPQHPGDVKADQAMQAGPPAKTVNRISKLVNPGGIDFTKTNVSVNAPNGTIQLSFDDPALLRLLLNADGLAPIIYDVKAMTPAMANHFVGLDY